MWNKLEFTPFPGAQSKTSKKNQVKPQPTCEHPNIHTQNTHTHTSKEKSENLHMRYLYAFPIRAPYSDKFYKSITFYWDVSIAVCLWGGHSTLLSTKGLNSFLPLGWGEMTLSVFLGSGESSSDGSSLCP